MCIYYSIFSQWNKLNFKCTNLISINHFFFSLKAISERCTWGLTASPRPPLHPCALPYLANAWTFMMCRSSCSATFLFKVSTSCRSAAECSISPSSRLRSDLEKGDPSVYMPLTRVHRARTQVFTYPHSVCINHNSSLSHLSWFTEIANSAQEPQSNNWDEPQGNHLQPRLCFPDSLWAA